MQKIILCSSSSRRISLFKLFFSDFECLSPDCEEISIPNNPQKTVAINSKRKADYGIKQFLNNKYNGSHLHLHNKLNSTSSFIMVSADTVVYYKKKILNKPKDYNNALSMLKLLNGNTHSVFTGISFYNSENNKFTSFYDKSIVTFYNHSEKTLEKYLKYEHFLDAAGSYKIQGLGIALIKHISGSYSNVLGFPIEKLYKYFKTSIKFLS